MLYKRSTLVASCDKERRKRMRERKERGEGERTEDVGFSYRLEITVADKTA